MSPLEEGNYSINSLASEEEVKRRAAFAELLSNSPIPSNQLLANLPLYLNSKSLARLLFMNHIYKQITDVMGVIMEFGTHWGANLAQFSALRGIYEPFNRHRKIIGFDTFQGFPEVSQEDGNSELMEKGHLNLPPNYVEYLSKVMSFHEQENPMSHIKKFDIREGDVINELPKYLEENPETIIALVYFDLDLYKPTRECLELIKARLVKGSLIGFDELNDPDSPGETIALMETFGLNNVRLKRLPFTSRASYFVYE